MGRGGGAPRALGRVGGGEHAIGQGRAALEAAVWRGVEEEVAGSDTAKEAVLHDLRGARTVSATAQGTAARREGCAR